MNVQRVGIVQVVIILGVLAWRHTASGNSADIIIGAAHIGGQA